MGAVLELIVRVAPNKVQLTPDLSTDISVRQNDMDSPCFTINPGVAIFGRVSGEYLSIMTKFGVKEKVNVRFPLELVLAVLDSNFVGLDEVCGFGS